MLRRRNILFLGSLMLVLLASRAAAQNEPVHDADINVIHFEALKYPHLAWQTRSEGLVVIRAKLDKEGKVVDAAAISGNPILIPDALENIKKWRFRPNKQGAVVFVYNFRILSADCAEDNQQFFTLELPNFVTVSACPIHLQTQTSSR
jgi:TonB family protein